MSDIFKVSDKGIMPDAFNVIAEQAACISLVCFSGTMKYERDYSLLP